MELIDQLSKLLQILFVDLVLAGDNAIVIGMVQATGGDMEGLGEREMKEGLRKEARRMGGDALIHLRREPSMYGLPQHRVDDVGYRDSRRQGIEYRWVAEVITYDLPAEIPADGGD